MLRFLSFGVASQVISRRAKSFGVVRYVILGFWVCEWMVFAVVLACG